MPTQVCREKRATSDDAPPIDRRAADLGVVTLAWAAHLIALQLAIQRRTLDPQYLGGLRLVPLRMVEHAQDMPLLQIIQCFQHKG